MRLSIPKVILYSIIVGIIITLFGISKFYGIGGIITSIIIVAFAVRHRKNKSKSRRQRHTDRRAGEIYNKNQNSKRGEKNQKYQKPENPNKKGNKKQKNDNNNK